MKRRIGVFGNMCLRRFMGYHSNDFVSNQRLLRETESRPITIIVRQRQFRLYEHVHAIQKLILLIGLLQKVIITRGVDTFCTELFGMKRGLAWTLARGDCRGWRGRMSKATRPLAYAPMIHYK